MRFYAAAPLRTQDGYNLGTLCIIDKNQHYINREQAEMLQVFAGVVMDEMELRLAARKASYESKQRIAELEKELKTLRST